VRTENKLHIPPDWSEVPVVDCMVPHNRGKKVLYEQNITSLNGSEVISRMVLTLRLMTLLGCARIFQKFEEKIIDKNV
jgi:hypothetical protein